MKHKLAAWSATVALAGAYFALCPVTAQAVTPAGKVRGWGINVDGELGNGFNVSTNVPAPMSVVAAVVAAAGGGAHSLALQSDGSVWSTGYNGSGQLGNGTLNPSNVPVQVTGLSGVTAIAAGDAFSLALKSNGTVWAWGYNGYGQLGDGNNVNSAVPVQVNGISGVVAIACGAYNAVALKSDGTVWAWGRNVLGQLGNGSDSDTNLPVQVSGLGGVVAIAGGGGHGLALKSDGTVWAWGGNFNGELGNGSTGNRNLPGQVSGLSGVVAIAGGGTHSIALLYDGTVRTWGDGSLGQLGNGSLSNSSTPVQVSGLSGVTSVAGGAGFSLATLSDGTARAWGFNAYGQLGNGTQSNSSVPVQVSGLTGAVGLGSNCSGYFSLAITVPAVTLNPASVNFGIEAVGGLSASSIVSIVNNGPDPLTITAISLGGANPGDFVLSSPPVPITLNSGASISAGVSFAPTAGGVRTADLLFTDNGFHSPQAVVLTGSGNGQADLAVGLGASPEPVRSTTNLTYAISVVNGGPALAMGVFALHTLPSATSFVSVTTTQGSCLAPNGGTFTLSCTLGNLSSGGSATIRVVVKVTAPGNSLLTSTASVSADSPDANPANNSATVVTKVFGSRK